LSRIHGTGTLPLGICSVSFGLHFLVDDSQFEVIFMVEGSSKYSLFTLSAVFRQKDGVCTTPTSAVLAFSRGACNAYSL
jgi:hypothetical protein